MSRSELTLNKFDRIKYSSRVIYDNMTLGMLMCILLSIALGLFITLLPIKIILLVIALIITLIISYIKPEYTLYIVMASVIITTETVSEELINSGGILLIEDIKIMQGVPPATIAMLLLLFIIYFSKQIVSKRQQSPISFKYLLIYAGLLSIALVNGLLNGATSADIKNDFIRLIYPLLCFYLCVNILDDSKKNLQMIWVVFIACIVKTVILDVNYLSGHGQAYEDYTIVTMDSAVLMAVGIMISLVFALAMFKKEQKGFTLILLALLPMVFALVFSFRRAHWIGQFVSLAVLYLWIPPALKRKMVLSVLACAFLLVFTYVIVTGKLFQAMENGPSMLSRIESIFDPNQHSNKHHYLESITTLQDILQKPVLGMGLGGMHSPVSENIIDWPEEDQPLHVVHNTFIYLWMKLGLPGLFFSVWAGVAYLKKLNEYRKSTDHKQSWPYIAGIGSGVGVWLVMFITGPVPWYFHQTFLVVLFSALCINLIRLDKNERYSADRASSIPGVNDVPKIPDFS